MTAETAAKRALATVARRWRSLDEEARELSRHIKDILDHVAPHLVAVYGVGFESSGQLLVTAGDNPDRLRHEQSFAALCGASPVQASSGRTNRHRLNRGGDRRTNSAPWTVVLVRMAGDSATKTYVERRIDEGLSKPEIMRCLKRYVARALFPLIQAITNGSALEEGAGEHSELLLDIKRRFISMAAETWPPFVTAAVRTTRR